MASSEYICKNCKNVKSAGFLSKTRYKCPNHGFICPDCVDEGFFSTKCKECEVKVVTYKWNGKRWVNS